jgi:cytochrome d ubiquinol oxidase subunit I
MMLDVLFLSRLQFALTIMFHYIFPPLTIGLGVLLVLMEGAYLVTKNPVYESMARFWTRIYALNFAMGVASGIVMEFEFGTNWATYSRFVGDVFGSPLAAEGVFAFFLESGFLAVLVFGWDRVSPRMHFFSTVMVALGSMFSAVWIVVANSWQQTPAGFHIVGTGADARAEITDFWAMVFNPSSMDRLVHTLIGAFILGAFFVMSVCAWYLLRRRHEEFARRGFTIALLFAAVSSLLALASGHYQANTVAVTQPVKLAAYEGHFRSDSAGATLYLFGVPDREERRVKMGIGIPGGLSFLVHGDFTTPVPALDAFPRRDWPPIVVPFMSYHLMVALGMAFIAVTLLALFFLWRRSLFEQRWLLWLFVPAVLGPMAANQAGWISAEVGRQPWIVYGLLRTGDALSKAVAAQQVWWSLILFSVIYAALGVIWLSILHGKISHGPDATDAADA